MGRLIEVFQVIFQVTSKCKEKKKIAQRTKGFQRAA